jgi:hypothetical protein
MRSRRSRPPTIRLAAKAKADHSPKVSARAPQSGNSTDRLSVLAKLSNDRLVALCPLLPLQLSSSDESEQTEQQQTGAHVTRGAGSGAVAVA